MHKPVSLLLSILILLAAMPAHAEISSADMRRLGLAYYNRFIPYAASSEAHELAPAVLAEVQAIDSKGELQARYQAMDKGPVLERYKAMAKGMALMYLGDWNEGVQLATQLDIRLSALLFEPGDKISINIYAVYPHDAPLDSVYRLNARLLDGQGSIVATADPLPITAVKDKSLTLAVPGGATPGLHTVEFQLAEDKDGGTVYYTAKRPMHVMPGVRGRLTAARDALEQARIKGLPSVSLRNSLSDTTLEWYLDLYEVSAGLTDEADTETLPMFLYFLMSQRNMNTGRIDFSGEIDLVETLANGMLGGSDPLETMTGDLRLAYRSSVDQALVPFRIMVPESFSPAKEYPLVIGLHGAGGTENYLMDGFDRLFPDNANRRGYIAVAVNGRGPYHGYHGKGETDVIDVMNLVQRAWPVKAGNTFLTGHSMGGAGTVLVGFGHHERFAALAPIAGWHLKIHLEKAVQMPLLISAGEKDALVSVEDMRKFHQMALELEMPDVEYIEVQGAAHVGVVNDVLDRVFDWFDQHSK
jgi:alpha-beta hydrolase superfamily lysophospholipase